MIGVEMMKHDDGDEDGGRADRGEDDGAHMMVAG
jgi:hypothetical protein